MIVNIQDNEIQIGSKPKSNNKIEYRTKSKSNIVTIYRKYVENYGYNFSIKFVHSLDNICEYQQSFVIQI